MTDIELRSLAPEYSEEHHETYVSRLNAAVSDPRNKNIALTGRYGVGKSSILDEFITCQENPENKKAKREKVRTKSASSKKVLRISINTLGPDKGEDLTNRIQKELVKQLVYRAKPGEVRSSEFARAPRLTWWRAGAEALVITVALVGLLWLFGLHPKEDSLGTDGFLWPMIVFSLLVLAILWAIRWYIGSRVVAQVSAGGASIALEGKSDSFFDKYLDELIAFFEATEPDIVVFEDLDRFDDPRIFDSLRELNTLVNTSAHWKDRPDRPLRFVYAIKDSLFEKLGDEQQEKDEVGKQPKALNAVSVSDASAPAETNDGMVATAPTAEKKDPAAEALERANRTKFFEIVIPVVPFLSHSNARDHFLKELGKLKLPEGTKIDHGLIDIVARYTTDMRLMINIGNEFIVYAERLLWVDEDKRAPALTADRLFALVVYKNFHLADFEALPHRGSALDTLDQSRRHLVDESIKRLQTERANLKRGVTQRHKQSHLSAQLGQRIKAFQGAARMVLSSARVESEALDVTATNVSAFWQPIGRYGSVEMSFRHRSGHNELVQLARDELSLLFPEAADSENWLDSPPSDVKRIAKIDEEIATLRGADFKYLVDDDRYELKDQTFNAIVKHTLPSDIAVDLVKQGHIDRFYAEYATVFYGEFLGVDVAKFFRNNVWPNEMDIQFSFNTEGAMANVLEQAPTDFLGSRSALNIDIVDHLMSLDAAESTDFIDFLARPNNTEGRLFLTTYFNDPGSRSEELVLRLAANAWSELFSFIASEGTIDADETSRKLLNVALLNAPDLEAFKLDNEALALLGRLHTEIPAFRDPQPGAAINTRFAFLKAALPSIPDLRAISPALRELAVNTKRYDLTVENVRIAAALPDQAPISADSLITKPTVWAYCAENIDTYLELVENDEHTRWSFTAPETLIQVVDAQHEDWSNEQLERFLKASSESSALPDLTELDQTVWQTVITASRAIPNAANLEAYATAIGVDDALAALLTDDDGAVIDIADLDCATEEQLDPLVTLLINAQATLTPRQRALLTKQVLDAPESPGLDPNEITPTPDRLLAELLQENLVDDSEDIFAHFSGAGWPSIGPALQISANAATFITPDLLGGHALDVIRDGSVPAATRRAVLEHLDDFARFESPDFRTVAATTARTLSVLLPVESLRAVATHARDPEDVLWQLRQHGSSISANNVKEMLGVIPGDFAGFTGSRGHEFDVAESASLPSILDRLRSAGVIEFPRGRPRGRRKVRIT